MEIDPELGNLDASYSEEPVPANISINVGYGIEVSLNDFIPWLNI